MEGKIKNLQGSEEVSMADQLTKRHTEKKGILEELYKEYKIPRTKSKEPAKEKPQPKPWWKKFKETIFKEKKPRPIFKKKARKMTRMERLRRINYLIDTGKEYK